MRSENPIEKELPVLWIVTKAGPRFGFGHLRRTLALVRILGRACRPLYIHDPSDRWTRHHVSGIGLNCFAANLDQAFVLLPAPSTILIDSREHKGLDGFVQEAVRRKVPVASLHDLGLDPLPSDIVIDGSILAREDSYPRRDCRFLLGPSHMVLDPAFGEMHRRRREIRREISTVVINLGGGDARHFMPILLEGLRAHGRPLQVTAFPGFTDWGQADLSARDWLPLRFKWASAGESVASSLWDSDLALTAGGLSAYEALAAGTPLAALSYDEHQHMTVLALARAGACIDLGVGRSLNHSKLTEIMGGLHADHQRRSALSERGRVIVDGDGAHRVARILAQLLETEGSWQAEARLRQPLGAIAERG